VETYCDLVIEGEAAEVVKVTIAEVGGKRNQDQKHAGEKVPPALPVEQGRR
jgi:hypothetical protein